MKAIKRQKGRTKSSALRRFFQKLGETCAKAADRTASDDLD